ncbi:hypothetical protein CDG81_13020 [Actinopolyspora erythraea]|uniref:DUF3375 domain-containing protein n=1 Tax=Actinopolyspora erythraea TaxID=414996 RepID=A0A099D5G0_9ACTN|nr:hypothetical protein [Actinopolyspora erythraea]ASU79054.1 hypothetical protein CDG81_13020 [Actinopolyspora erythraea]KGI81181.1 hypothetical protein IL38_13125 [Actinopolyspora erythraea]
MRSDEGTDAVPLARDVAIPTDDESITRRRRALAPIQVLTDIERTKTSLDGEFWEHYDLFTLSLAVVDQVALAMGISAGRTWDEIVEYAAKQAARQHPDGGVSEWDTVAERVVVSLVTTEVETVPYLSHTLDGPRWLAQRFRLLYMQASGTEGTEHLRASEQAINIFLEALDLDIEAAQIANEAQLSALIERGAVESAVQIAQHERYRSVQLLERIRRIVADTLLDPDTHDWIEDVPALLGRSLDHVKARLDAEAELLEAVTDRRAELDDPHRLDAANQLVEVLRECRHRHDQLHRHLINARSKLREAVDDRLSRSTRAVSRSEIGKDLLSPYMRNSVREAAASCERMMAAVGGVGSRWMPAMSTLIEELCAPPRPPQQGEEYLAPEFDDADQPEWWEPYEDTVEAMFEAIEEPVTLSALLERAAGTHVTDVDGTALDTGFLQAALVHAAHRVWATWLAGRSAGDRMLVAVPTGERLVSERVDCSELLLVPAVITADIDARYDVETGVSTEERETTE